MASGLLIKQKQLIAGDGITIEHAQTSSTISLSNSTLNAAVRIYDATIASDTGVVTITDGTPVADLNIGDEIRTTNGVLKKVASSTEVASDPSTGDIQVMGFTNPTAANGLYKFQSDRKWKHTSANYWITTSGNAWVISSLETPTAPSAGLCYSETADEEMPYEVTSWQRVSSYGTPLLYPAAVTAIVSGITSNQTANGKYLPTGNAYEWKHETEDWWITLYSRGIMNYPCIANTPNPTGDILSSSEYVATYTGFVLPWNVPTWSRSGSTVVEMGDTNIVVTDTVSLFEYASTSVASADIVQSVNGNKPDASGNVTIDTSSGGLTSVSVGNGLTGNGTSSSPIKLDLSTAVMEHDCSINAQGHTFIVGNLSTASIQTIDIDLAVSSEFSVYVTNHNISVTINEGGIDIQTAAIRLNSCSQNTAGGFAIVGEDGKLPSSILPDSSIDLSNYSTTSNISLKTTGSSTGVALGSTNGTVSIYSGYDGNGLSIGSTSCSYSGGNVSLSGKLSTSVGSYGAGTTTINATSLTNLKLRIGSSGTASSANTAGGFVVLGSDGKIPTSLYEQAAGGLTSVDTGNAINTGLTGDGTASSPISLDLSNYGTRDAISLTTFGGFAFKISATTAMSIGTDANVRIATHTYLAGNSGADVYFHGNATNTANGLVVLGADGKLPSSIIPVSSNRHPFTSSDLSSNVLTITTTGNVTGVIDDSGKAWNFADEEVTYTDSTVSVDLSGVFARKGIAAPTGTWKLMLYGA